MTDSIEDRLHRVEDAIIALADLRDPAQRDFPLVSRDRRTQIQNDAEKRVWALAGEIRRSRAAEG